MDRPTPPKFSLTHAKTLWTHATHATDAIRRLVFAYLDDYIENIHLLYL